MPKKDQENVPPRIGETPNAPAAKTDETATPPVNPTPQKVTLQVDKPKAAKDQIDPSIQALIDQITKDREEFNKRMEAMEKKHEDEIKKLKIDNQEAINAFKPLDGTEKVAVEEAHKSKAQRMKEHLDSQPRVTIMVPLEGKEIAGKTFLPVQLNGFAMNIPKGQYVEVPQQIADIVRDSQQMTEERSEERR